MFNLLMILFNVETMKLILHVYVNRIDYYTFNLIFLNEKYIYVFKFNIELLVTLCIYTYYMYLSYFYNFG